MAYLFPGALIWGAYLGLKKRHEKASLVVRDQELEAGLTEPASLHPVIDAKLCQGCAACVHACPENKVLGIIGRKAQLIGPTHCVGHGACKTSCPFDAITLVFGTAKRGVDIPQVEPNFETNVPGIFIAGELGGMGLIRNAVTQGHQALDFIRKKEGVGQGKGLDVVVVGGGPAGFSASLAAMEKKLRYVTLEQDTLGGTVSHFPRGKVVMTAPMHLPMYGKVKMRETSKEALLELWEEVEKKSGVKINYKERVEAITKNGNGFEVKTQRHTYQTKTVLLAIGRRGTPRKLGVPGEELPKVVYRLIDPEQYKNQHVLVVGGGDSAIEAATSIADKPGTTVSISYRSEAFSRAKQKNRERVQELQEKKKLKVLMSSTVVSITETHVELDQKGTSVILENNAVIVCAGGILPTGFLKEVGISVETKYGTP
ncbi:MAG: NAD(P)-binding domain-containing protein [Nitrospinaceae bacterium]